MRGRPDAGALREKAHLLARGAVKMGVAAVNVGRRDLAGGVEFLLQLGREPGVPWVSSNLRRTGGSYPFPRWRIVEWGGSRWLVLGLIRPERSLDASLGVEVQPAADAVTEVLERAPRHDAVAVLSNLGLDAERELAEELPEIALIVGGGTSHYLPVPPVVGNTLLLRAGDRGRYLGILDLPESPIRSWQRPVNIQERRIAEQRLKADRQRLAEVEGGAETGEERDRLIRILRARVEAGEATLEASGGEGVPFTHRLEALSPSLKEDPEVAGWVREYKEQLHRQQSVQVSRPPVSRPPAPESAGALHVGTATCRSCHGEAYRAWLGTAHARAYASLGANNQDPACLECHATRLRRAAGRSVEPVVGCEACHGPGGNHRTSANIARRPGPAVCGGCHRGHHPQEAFEFRRAYEVVRCDRSPAGE